MFHIELFMFDFICQPWNKLKFPIVSSQEFSAVILKESSKGLYESKFTMFYMKHFGRMANIVDWQLNYPDSISGLTKP